MTTIQQKNEPLMQRRYETFETQQVFPKYKMYPHKTDKLLLRGKSQN